MDCIRRVRRRREVERDLLQHHLGYDAGHRNSDVATVLEHRGHFSRHHHGSRGVVGKEAGPGQESRTCGDILQVRGVDYRDDGLLSLFGYHFPGHGRSGVKVVFHRSLVVENEDLKVRDGLLVCCGDVRRSGDGASCDADGGVYESFFGRLCARFFVAARQTQCQDGGCDDL